MISDMIFASLIFHNLYNTHKQKSMETDTHCEITFLISKQYKTAKQATDSTYGAAAHDMHCNTPYYFVFKHSLYFIPLCYLINIARSNFMKASPCFEG